MAGGRRRRGARLSPSPCRLHCPSFRSKERLAASLSFASIKGRFSSQEDLSTEGLRALVHQLSLDDEALLVIGQGAGLESDERLAFFGFHDLDVVRVDDLLSGNAVLVRIPRLVLEQDLRPLGELVEVVEDEVRARALVPEAMAGDVGVGPSLPGEARGGMWTVDFVSFSSEIESLWKAPVGRSPRSAERLQSIRFR